MVRKKRWTLEDVERHAKLVSEDKNCNVKSRNVDGSKVGGKQVSSSGNRPNTDSAETLVENECQRDIKNICQSVSFHLGKPGKKPDSLIGGTLIIKPCSCGHNRWKTVEKGKRYKCRKPKCGRERVLTKKEQEQWQQKNGGGHENQGS